MFWTLVLYQQRQMTSWCRTCRTSAPEQLFVRGQDQEQRVVNLHQAAYSQQGLRFLSRVHQGKVQATFREGFSFVQVPDPENTTLQASKTKDLILDSSQAFCFYQRFSIANSLSNLKHQQCKNY